jgi:hypothetical protein
MPIYEFRDKETGETWEEFLSMSAKEEYLAENPHAELVIGAPAFISGIAGVTHKNDDGFKDLLNRIGNANLHSDSNTETKALKPPRFATPLIRPKTKNKDDLWNIANRV